jgi:hypothetical protein
METTPDYSLRVVPQRTDGIAGFLPGLLASVLVPELPDLERLVRGLYEYCEVVEDASGRGDEVAVAVGVAYL